MNGMRAAPLLFIIYLEIFYLFLELSIQFLHGSQINIYG